MNEFGVRIGATFRRAFGTFFRNVGPLALAAALTLGVYAAFRYPAQQLFNDDRVYTSIAVDLVGLILSGTLAIPWYTFALRAARGEKIELAEPFRNLLAYRHQLVASFWFWAGILLGFRYLLGLPSILVLLLYSFHGFIIADGHDEGGLKALGTSVRLTEGKRIGLFAIAGLMLIFNMLGVTPLYVGSNGEELDANIITVGSTALLLMATSSITLVFGAYVYDAFNGRLDQQPPPPS